MLWTVVVYNNDVLYLLCVKQLQYFIVERGMFNLLHPSHRVFQCWFPGEVQHVLLLEGHVRWPACSQITAVIQVSRFNLSYNWPIHSPPFCPGLHGLCIACLNTYYNMKAISLHYNITDQLSYYLMVICTGMVDKWIQ